MAAVTFFGKPGCAGNRRQMAILQASGHQVTFRNLLEEPWTESALRAFLGDAPVAGWFNLSAPKVKSGAIEPSSFDAAGALAALLAEPLLIRRPLLEAEGRRMVGWQPEQIAGWIGLASDRDPGSEACPRQDTPAERCEPPTAG